MLTRKQEKQTKKQKNPNKQISVTLHNETLQSLFLQRTQKLNSKKLFTSFNEPPASSYKSQRERKSNVENSTRQLPAWCSRVSIALIFCTQSTEVQGTEGTSSVRQTFNFSFKYCNLLFIVSIT